MLVYAWAFVPPIFTSLIWIFLQSQKVLGVGDTGMPYVVFVITGTVLWQTFVEALNSPLQMVNSSKSMLTKINFPREALILTGAGQVLFNFAIRALLLVAVMLYFRISPHASPLPGFLWVSGLSLLLLVLAWVQYRMALPHLISRVSA